MLPTNPLQPIKKNQETQSKGPSPLQETYGLIQNQNQLYKLTKKLLHLVKKYQRLPEGEAHSLKKLMNYLYTLFEDNLSQNQCLLNLLWRYQMKTGDKVQKLIDLPSQESGLKISLDKLLQPQKKQPYHPPIVNQNCEKMSRGYFEIPNQHLCCSKFYYEGWKIHEKVKQIITVQQKIFIEDENLEKVVCAAANCKNGAYIVCGVDEKNMKVVGEPISEGHKDFYDDRVREAKNNLKSVKSDKITITVKLIPVLENPNLKYSSINAGRFVIVINVSPCLRNIYYLKHDEGYKSYEFTDKRVEEIGVERLYEEMHLRWKRKKSEYREHSGECCSVTLNYERVYQKSEKQLVDEKRYSTFKYENNYTFLNGKISQNQLRQKLRIEGVQYKLTRPYQKEQKRNKNDKKIYLLSTQHELNNLKDFNVFRITNALKINNSKISEQFWKSYVNEFQSIFGEVFRYQWNRVEEGIEYILAFNSEAEALFSYIVLRRFRPLFKRAPNQK